MARVLFIEPYYGGSHKYFADLFVRHSRHQVTLLTMPARFWKWRMWGAAVEFAYHPVVLKQQFDAIFCSDFLDLALFASLAPTWVQNARKVYYMHENQLAYPLSKHDQPDLHYGLANIHSALASDVVLFNSNYNEHSFLSAIEPLMKRFPDRRISGLAARIEQKSHTVYLPIDIREILSAKPANCTKSGPARIVWNHRWEYDKGIDTFVELVSKLMEHGADFELYMLGNRFSKHDPSFARLEKIAGERLAHVGFVSSRQKYLEMLWCSDLVVSTAQHEFFGISVAEAVLCGCFPVLPNRLSYVELVPEQFLYLSFDDLLYKVLDACINIEDVRNHPPLRCYDQFEAQRVVSVIDGFFE